MMRTFLAHVGQIELYCEIDDKAPTFCRADGSSFRSCIYAIVFESRFAKRSEASSVDGRKLECPATHVAGPGR